MHNVAERDSELTSLVNSADGVSFLDSEVIAALNTPKTILDHDLRDLSQTEISLRRDLASRLL
jgi:hypothetical protein